MSPDFKHSWVCSSNRYDIDNNCDCGAIPKFVPPDPFKGMKLVPKDHTATVTRLSDYREKPTGPLLPSALVGRRQQDYIQQTGPISEFMPETYTIISLSGYAQSGKDTLAKFLVDNHGYIRLAFADALKAATLALDPLIPMPAGSHYRLSTLVDIMGMETAKLEFPEVRRLLQVMGTEVGRQLLGPNIWVDKVVEQFEHTKKYVITDTRFDNEFTRLRDLGATMVWIGRPGVGPVNGHASESSLLDKTFDARINNDGTLEDLEEIAKDLTL